MMLYLSMCLAFLLIHLDDGILSIASEQIIHDLNFTEADLGLIEAAVYLGMTIGCLICPMLFAQLNPKLLVLFGVLSTSCCVSAWVLVNSFWLLATCRFLNGIFLVSIFFKLQCHVIVIPFKNLYEILLFDAHSLFSFRVSK